VHLDDPVSPSNISVVNPDGKTIGGYAEAGIADDVKINAALSAYKSVYLPEGPFVLNAGISSWQNHGRLFGAGPSTVLKPVANSTNLLTPTDVSDIGMEDFSIEGNGKTGCQGVVLTTTTGRLQNIKIAGMKTGIRWISDRGVTEPYFGYRGTIVDCDLAGCSETSSVGISIGHTSAKAEYIAVVNPRIGNYKLTGLAIGGANVDVINPMITECYYGVQIWNGGSSNLGHGSIVGGSVNHCTTNGILIQSVPYESIVGVNVVVDTLGIVLDGAYWTGISGCYLGTHSSAAVKILNGAHHNLIEGNRILSNYGLPGGGSDYGIRELDVSDYNYIKNNTFDATWDNAMVSLLGAHSNAEGNTGYIAPGEIRTYSGLIATLTENAFNSLDNPFGQSVALLALDIYVSTGATATSPNIDCGIGSSATADYTNLFDDLPGETIGLYNSKIATPGAQTQPILWQSGAGNRYLNMSIKDAAATGMVATYVATVMGL
jgi:hypothetical protein